MKITGAVLERMGDARPYVESQPITVGELELGEPGPGEILVRIEAAGICHSDLSVVDGNRPRPLPMLLGHEAAGIVEQLGEGVTQPAIGSRVVMTFLPRCGECRECSTDGRLPCSRGSATNGDGTLLEGTRRLDRGGEVVHHHLGVSGFATHAVVDHRSVVEVGDDVPADIAAVLGCAVLTGGGAVLNAGRPMSGDAIAVVGLGGVGMAALLVAIGLGHGEVIAVDAVEEKLVAAREAGATKAYTPAEAVEAGVRAVVVVEAAGHPRAFETALAITAAGGTTVTVGLPPAGAMSEISPLTLTAEARTVIGSYLGSAVPSRDIPYFAQLWREGRLELERLISGHIALADINQAMDDLAEGRVLRQIIEF